ncbi:carbohydrate ABC transporter permease [Shinella sp. BYT-45]|uniref:carbohydrate ABC transporter permease n=1 Tax=Shinella sp. BYT-45 TaxID=3377377 RepID=UPI0039817170
MSRGARTKKIWFTILAWSVILTINFPLIWMISSSLKNDQENNSVPPTLLPQVLEFGNYARLFNGDFMIWVRNSLLVAGGTVVIVIVLGTLAAYSLTRYQYRGRQAIATIVLFTYLFPPVLMLVPIFLIISKLGLSNTPFALILATTTFALPFSIWLLRSYFESVSMDTEEAAMIDGASRFTAFIEIVIPQVSPGVISTAIFTFILAWDEYLFASVLISSPERKTVPIGIASYANELTSEWGVLMAASILTTIPILALFSLLQRRLLPDLSAGATKN